MIPDNMEQHSSWYGTHREFRKHILRA